MDKNFQGGYKAANIQLLPGRSPDTYMSFCRTTKVNEVTPNQSSKRPMIVRWLKTVFVAWVCMKIGGCVLMLTGPWGPRVGGVLPNGHSIYFQSRPIGRETDDRLTWTSPDQKTQHFWVDQIHAGFDHVTIKYTNNGDRVWVESDGKVGASIDLVTSDFRAEHDPQHAWATMGSGNSLDAGSTGSIIWLLGPW